jgi:hypothetical protein
VRFSNDDATTSKTMEIKVKLDPSWKTLRLRTRMRANVTALGDQGWYGARLTQQFINDKGLVMPYPPQPSLRETSREWVQVDETLTIPDSATHLQMTPGCGALRAPSISTTSRFRSAIRSGGVETAQDARSRQQRSLFSIRRSPFPRRGRGCH